MPKLRTRRQTSEKKSLDKKSLDKRSKDESPGVSKDEDYNEPDEVVKEKKRMSKRAHRLIGTPDYMAPEIICGKSISNYTIDWWALGVMLFEFLVGIPPFNDDTVEKIYDNITHLRIPWDDVPIGRGSDCVSPEAYDLINKLLVLDPEKRLGANGAQEIKDHIFFRGFHWDTFRDDDAPIVPEKKSNIDTDNFQRMQNRIGEKEKQDPFFSV
mmetsp:Transcript_34812/g.31346  ORF Transcript_34812/g.31346 Transcript_34812/m.31346 type:complete len:212 (+) Transcript_34812:1506-2141(+)